MQPVLFQTGARGKQPSQNSFIAGFVFFCGGGGVAQYTVHVQVTNVLWPNPGRHAAVDFTCGLLIYNTIR